MTLNELTNYGTPKSTTNGFATLTARKAQCSHQTYTRTPSDTDLGAKFYPRPQRATAAERYSTYVALTQDVAQLPRPPEATTL